MPPLLDLRLVIVYNGVKATQYFTKFTQESLGVFRRDLTTLKLPHPKRENIVFVSHGHIECLWCDVPKDGILYKNIRDKSQPNTDEGLAFLKQKLKDLSIGHIFFKILDPKGSKKRANPYSQNPLNEQEGSRPSKAARTAITQPPLTVPTPQGVQPSHPAPFTFKRNPAHEVQTHALPSTNNKSSDATTAPTLNAPPTPTGVRQILVNPRPGPRSIPAPRVSLAELTKTLGEQSGGQGLHTHDGTKQPPPTPKVPLSERKDSAPIPSPQFPGSTQQRAASTHLLPLRQVASLPGNTFSAIAASSTQVPTKSISSSSTQNVPSSIPVRPSFGSTPVSGKSAPLASSSSQGTQELAVKEEPGRTPPLPGLWRQQRESRDQPEMQMLQKQVQEGVAQNRPQPRPQPQPPLPPASQELVYQRRRNSRWSERDSHASTSAVALPTPPTSTSSSSGGFTIKTEPGLEPQRSFTPDPYNPSAGPGYNPFARPGYIPIVGAATEANATPLAVQRNGQPYRAIRPRIAIVDPSSSTSGAEGPSAPAPNAADSITIQRLTREVWSVKRQISANVERERVIIQELEKLGSHWVPEGTVVDSPLPANGPNHYKKRKREGEWPEGGETKYLEDQIAISNSLVTMLKTRLTKTESSLSQTQATLSQTQAKLAETEAHLAQSRAELMNSQAEVAQYRSKLARAQTFLTQAHSTIANEQRLRREAEEAIADVRRECVKPFVVPSLLDAFVEVSKLTTRAMVSGQRRGGGGAAAVEDEKEERRREKGKSVDMGPPPPLLQQQRTAPSLSQSSSMSTTSMEKKVGYVQPRPENGGGPRSGSSSLAAANRTLHPQRMATTTMNIGQTRSLPGRPKPQVSPNTAEINGVSVGTVVTTIPPHSQRLPPKSTSATGDVHMRSATPIGHKIAPSLPTTMTVEGRSSQPNTSASMAPEISGDVDMAAVPISTSDRSPRRIPLIHQPPPETISAVASSSTKEHVPEQFDANNNRGSQSSIPSPRIRTPPTKEDGRLAQTNGDLPPGFPPSQIAVAGLVSGGAMGHPVPSSPSRIKTSIEESGMSSKSTLDDTSEIAHWAEVGNLAWLLDGSSSQ